MKQILFVCTGNIFRSMIAEYTLRAALAGRSDIQVGSAGIVAMPQEMREEVRSRLLEKGIDPSAHIQRRVTAELLKSADLVIAMGFDHQAALRATFGYHVPLFNEVCNGQTVAVLDIHEAIIDWQNDSEAVRRHIVSVVDHIADGVPNLAKDLDRLLSSSRPRKIDLTP